MNEILLALITLIGVIISVSVSYLINTLQTKQQIANLKLELEHRYTSKLYEKRLEAYPKLYQITNEIARAIRDEEICPETMQLAYKRFVKWDSEYAIYASALTVKSLIRFRDFLRKHLESGAEYLKDNKVRKEILDEAFAVEAILKTELGVFSVEGFHNPAKAKRLSEVISSLQKVIEEDDKQKRK